MSPTIFQIAIVDSSTGISIIFSIAKCHIIFVIAVVDISIGTAKFSIAILVGLSFISRLYFASSRVLIPSSTIQSQHARFCFRSADNTIQSLGQ